MSALATRQQVGLLLTAGVLFAGTVALQVARDRRYGEYQSTEHVLYLPSARVMSRVALSYKAILADLYWLRTVQYYGGTRLFAKEKRYDLLEPLLDITTTLDPRFQIAYRFGAIFLSEPYPGGPGTADRAVALLKKGAAADPSNWLYYEDAGFVYYWTLHDYKRAAEWFLEASKLPTAPEWLAPLAANTLAKGGDRRTSRFLWEKVLQSSEQDWMRRNAERHLAQLRALDAIDALNRTIEKYILSAGEIPRDWNTLVRAGMLRGVPLDPAGKPYRLDPNRGCAVIDPASPLAPLPVE